MFKIKKITIDNIKYSYLLKQIEDPPKILFYVGNIDLLNTPCVSIVGTRRPSKVGKIITQKLVEKLSKNFTIVSGLAKGIDKIANYYGMKYFGRTIAVLANGLNTIYPEENLELAKRIVENGGLIISEYDVNSLLVPENFPRRNRIISGLSMDTIVVEAGKNSGAIITAKNAIDQNRNVYSVPWRLDYKEGEGCNLLIKNGSDIVLL